MQRRSHRYANDRDRNNRSELGPALGHCMLQMRDIPKLYGQDGAFRGLITTSTRRHTTHRRRYINVVSSAAVTRFSSIFSLSFFFFFSSLKLLATTPHTLQVSQSGDASFFFLHGGVYTREPIQTRPRARSENEVVRASNAAECRFQIRQCLRKNTQRRPGSRMRPDANAGRNDRALSL